MEINRTVYKDVSKGLKVKFELEALKTEPVQIAEAELLSNSFLYSFKSSAETLKREKKKSQTIFRNKLKIQMLLKRSFNANMKIQTEA